MSKQTRTAALRGLIGECVDLKRGDVRLATGNLLGPLDMLRGRRRLWGAAYNNDGRLGVVAFDPLDADISIELAV